MKLDEASMGQLMEALRKRWEREMMKSQERKTMLNALKTNMKKPIDPVMEGMIREALEDVE